MVFPGQNSSRKCCLGERRSTEGTSGNEKHLLSCRCLFFHPLFTLVSLQPLETCLSNIWPLWNLCFPYKPLQVSSAAWHKCCKCFSWGEAKETPISSLWCPGPEGTAGDVSGKVRLDFRKKFSIQRVFEHWNSSGKWSQQQAWQSSKRVWTMLQANDVLIVAVLCRVHSFIIFSTFLITLNIISLYLKGYFNCENTSPPIIFSWFLSPTPHYMFFPLLPTHLLFVCFFAFLLHCAAFFVWATR